MNSDSIQIETVAEATLYFYLNFLESSFDFSYLVGFNKNNVRKNKYHASIDSKLLISSGISFPLSKLIPTYCASTS
jgi:hypothetical protein